jgi:hemoglobin-like flavoprotein
MTPEQARLVTKSFDEMWPVHRVLAGRFYTHFFAAMPDARRLFPNEMEKQHRKLMDTIAAIVGSASNQPLCRSIVSNTARQHARFGVTLSQLAAFGDALILSLEEQFGPAFTPELRQAWVALYEIVQSEMISAGELKA